MEDIFNNKYHRYLDLPFEIKPHPMFSEFPKNPMHKDTLDYKQPEMDEWLKSIGCVVQHTEVFYTAPGTIIPIHADNIFMDNHVKINLTFGPEEGKVIWWKSNNPFAASAYANEYNDQMAISEFGEERVKEARENWTDREGGTNVVLPNTEDCVQVWEAHTNRPSLLNVGQLHSTWCPDTEGRWTICFVPAIITPQKQKWIQWYDALEVFKDYIVEEETIG